MGLSSRKSRGRPPGKTETKTESTLVNRNVTVGGRRTSLRLEEPMWEALHEIARRENESVHQICTLVNLRRRDSSLTAAIRVFILTYFRAAATEDGHNHVGHGRRDFRQRGR